MTRKGIFTAALATVALVAMPLAPAGATQGGPPPAGGSVQGPPQGPGGRGFGPAQDLQIVKQFDKDGDGRLNTAERRAALEYVKTQAPAGRMGGPRGGGATGSPGARIAPKDVASGGSAPLYDLKVLRTIFIEFEDADWEDQLMTFKSTDVEVPATMIVDGKTYKDVGISFRGMSSFMSVPAGLKHSLNLSMDYAHADQRLLGFKTLNLLNSHSDPTYLRSVLFLEASRSVMPAPRANYLRVAINGESWGVYVNVEQFNSDAVKTWYGSAEGARWKVPGSPGGRGGLEYLGDDPAAYRRLYEIKSKDNAKSWAALVELCRVLNQTPPEKLEAALAPILDVDETLKFLALDITFANADGYWVRASDYNLYQDVKGRFHILTHDSNEAFGGGGGGGRGRGPGGPGGPGDPMRAGGPPGGPPRAGGPPVIVTMPPGAMPPGPQGRGGPMGGGGPELDPLTGLNDATKPLRSKLLAVPALREKYLGYVKQIAAKWLDWNTLGPMAERYQALIAADVKADTRKLDTFEAFEAGVPRLKTWVEQRRTYLLNYK